MPEEPMPPGHQASNRAKSCKAHIGKAVKTSKSVATKSGKTSKSTELSSGKSSKSHTTKPGGRHDGYVWHPHLPRTDGEYSPYDGLRSSSRTRMEPIRDLRDRHQRYT